MHGCTPFIVIHFDGNRYDDRDLSTGRVRSRPVVSFPRLAVRRRRRPEERRRENPKRCVVVAVFRISFFLSSRVRPCRRPRFRRVAFAKCVVLRARAAVRTYVINYHRPLIISVRARARVCVCDSYLLAA